MKQLFVDIHKQLHTNVDEIVINGIPTKVQINKDKDNLRYVIFKDKSQEYEIVQQNPNTKSVYATRAREGEKISWLIPRMAGCRLSYGWKAITDYTLID